MDIEQKGLGLVFQFRRDVDEFFITVAAFNKSSVMRDHQPNAGVAQGPLRAITGHFPRGNDFGFWGIGGHVCRSLMAKCIPCLKCTGGAQAVTVAEPLGTAYVNDT
jgi:hypothetical protein